MSIHFYIFVFILTSTILSNVSSQNPIRQYVIRRDFFTGFKASELSVYDQTEKHIYYRVESTFAILQNIKVIVYPSKRIVGKLQAKIKPFVYKGEFSIVDPQSNQWMNGMIEQNFKFDGDLFYIRWGEYRISMRKELGSLTNKFHDTNGGEILAQFRIRPASIFWTNKYDMQIFSDKYPEQIYLLALAARDHMSSRNKIG